MQKQATHPLLPHTHCSPTPSLSFVSERNGKRIRRIEVPSGVTTTVAGSPTALSGSNNGIGTNARFDDPTNIGVAPDGLSIFVSEFNTNRIRRIGLLDGAVTTIAGPAVSTPGYVNGLGTTALLRAPFGFAAVPATAGQPETVYFADRCAHGPCA